MQSILIVGCTLLDVIATYDKKDVDVTSKIGKVNFSIGGAAFNVTSNLVANNYSARIFTYLSDSSLSAKIIREILDSARISTEYVLSTKPDFNIGETYCAQYADGELISGITCSDIDNVQFDRDKLKEAISKVSVVAVDTNLSLIQIRTVLNICKELKNKKVLAMIVSSPKADRFLNETLPMPFEIVSMNEEEARSINFDIDGNPTPSEVADFCKSLNTSKVYITRNIKGYNLLRADGRNIHTKGWPVANYINDLGAGDALFSALCVAVLKGDSVEDHHTYDLIRGWVSRVMCRQVSHMLDISFSTERETRRENHLTIIWMVVLLFAYTCSLLVGNFISINVAQFWCCAILSILALSGLGGIINNSRILLYKTDDKPLSFYPSMLLGMFSGLLTAVMFIFSHALIANKANHLRTSFEGLSSLVIVAGIIAGLAGLTADTVIKAFKKQGGDRLIQNRNNGFDGL